MQNIAQPAPQASGDIIVHPGECRFSTDPGCRLITRALGSCMALAVHAPKLSVAALLRFSLPAPPAHSPESNPWLYAETGIPFLFEHFRAIGAQQKDLSVYAVGGAMDGTEESASRGKSNELAMNRLLWRQGILLNGEDTGGTSLRSVWLEPCT